MPRVLVLNNYPLDTVWEQVRRGEMPGHVLFGVDHFAARGYECEFVACEDGAPPRGLTRALATCRFPFPLGNLERQWEALRRAHRFDLIFAASQTETALLACLRAIGAFQKPIVCLVHHPLNRGRLAAWRKSFFSLVQRGTDAFPCLSRRVASEIGEKAVVLEWGPDPAFYQPAQGPGHGIIACGRSGRDFVTFGQGASLTGCPARIICLETHITPEFGHFNANVEILTQPPRGWMKYRDLNPILASARALAIPLTQQEGLAGLTSLVDALGLGRAMIMTRNPCIDLDIEAKGIGRWVDPGDVAGWRDAIQWFDANPGEAAAMGQRARALVDAGLNAEQFANSLIHVFDRVLSST